LSIRNSETKDEITRRLYGILGIRAWERMFTQPKTKLDLSKEMNAGKVILINTAKSLLQPKGCEAFGRFFLALITMAAQRRATMAKKLPCHVFIDEVGDYASDANLNTIIEQCRKQKIALTVAHQNCSQLSQRVLDTFQTVAIKCAASLTARDAGIMASGMKANPQHLQDQTKGTFMVYVRGVTPRALPVTVPFGVLEGMEMIDDEQLEHLRNKLRELYATWPPKKEEPETEQPPHEEPADVQSPDGGYHDRTSATPRPEQSHEYGYPDQEPQKPEPETMPPKKRKSKKAGKDNVDTAASPTW
jgi:hypothetical protein